MEITPFIPRINLAMQFNQGRRGTAYVSELMTWILFNDTEMQHGWAVAEEPETVWILVVPFGLMCLGCLSVCVIVMG